MDQPTKELYRKYASKISFQGDMSKNITSQLMLNNTMGKDKRVADLSPSSKRQLEIALRWALIYAEEMER